MNSWDLFDTLVAAPDPTRPAGDQDEHFAIQENIAKVRPEDVIVSDYYNPQKAEKILRNVCGLSNRLYVTEDGKGTGKIWKTVHPDHHTGDHPITDVVSAKRAGIYAQLTTLAQPTEVEKQFQPDIAAILRRARLLTWDPNPVLRGLQLHQIERNFPFLLKVAYELDKVVRERGYTRLLLCSRDCFLLQQLMRRIAEGYKAEYFWSSRLTRYRPTEAYSKYAKSMIKGKTLIVDMCGSGNSLKFFCEKFGGDWMLVVGKENCLVRGGIRETSNPAPHDTVVDVPVVLTDSSPERSAMFHGFAAAFGACLYSLPVPTYTLEWALKRVEDPRTECLWPAHLEESTRTYELLKSGPLPHEVIL
jgi:hypothetical protein